MKKMCSRDQLFSSHLPEIIPAKHARATTMSLTQQAA
jgi:hypothetical protein